MQNVGFSFMLQPGLRGLGSDSDRSKFYGRFFNSQPFMAPTIAGVDLHLEAAGQPEEAEKLQRPLSSSLAAIGDTFFWGTIKPLIALLAVVCAINGSITGIVLSLIAFNLIRQAVCIWGFEMGFKEGPQGALRMSELLSINQTGFLAYFISLLCGLSLPLTFPGTSLRPEGLLLIFALSLVATRLNFSIFKVFYGVFTLILIWTIMI